MIIIVSVLITTAIYLFNPQTTNSKGCPLPEYRSYNGQVEDLFIVTGKCMVPTAIEAIKDQSLFKRPFIISFLGKISSKEALPTLITIVNSESDPHRASALIAVFRIDNEIGREYAKMYENQPGELGKYSRDILAGKAYLNDRKSYMQAWRNYIMEKYSL